MKTKTKKQLLADYKRSNKERRIKIWQKAGFDNEVEYLTYLRVDVFKQSTKVQPTDIVIAFDTTGSMRSYINSVKEHVTKLIPELFLNNPDLKLKIVAFGDYCDMKNTNTFGNAYQEIELTNNVNDLIKFVKNAVNTSGGDEDEFYELVIRKINTETQWRANSKRSVLLIADWNPHTEGYYKSLRKEYINWKNEAKEAVKLNIKYDTLRILDDVNWYQKLSNITNGISLKFTKSKNTNYIVDGYVTARTSGGDSKSFKMSMDSAMLTGDEELIGAYKQMSKL